MKVFLLNIFKKNKDYIFTFITEFIVLCSSILVYKFSATILGEEGFSIYALTRRTVSFILPMVMIGLGVALPRYIAFNHDNKKDINSLLVSSFLLFSISSFLLLIWFVLFKSNFSSLFFESSNYAYLIIPLVLYIFSLGLHALVYGYFRGNLIMNKANFIQLINIGIVPVLSFIFFRDIFSILMFSAIAVFLFSLVFIYPILSLKNINIISLKPYIKKIFNYGIKRTPGDIILAAYFTIPAYLITHEADIIVGGYVAFAITLINIFGATFTPISLILLPKASLIIKNKEYFKLKIILRKLLILSFSISIIGVIVIELFIPDILVVYLGESYLKSVPIIKILILGSVGYTLFVALRSIIDAYYERAVNTLNTIFSFLLMFFSFPIMYFFNTDYYTILWFFAISINVLGLLTLLHVIKIIKINN
ncbi:MAG: hypothetical protein A2X12_10405 [Bacteroidetes bacterium GWE2_29_8]|nr:MAG: hypothetical protein A2X12_10405 [Bacteroidetes bacterium GWE2_29_8]OFY16626.1 MAG: hypothetical protein A2X02_05665 [Bacteroidetes bacterium GWF2_29_10]